jgi:DNA-binding SARP family transcriptional activator
MLLDKLMVYCEANREYELGVEYGERILRCDRAPEYTHRRLMYLHYLRGSRTDALRQFARCVLALNDELAVPPAESTVRLCEQIRADREVDPLICLPVSTPVTAAHAAGASLGDRLRRLQRALTDLQRQVQAELLALEPKPPSQQR